MFLTRDAAPDSTSALLNHIAQVLLAEAHAHAVQIYGYSPSLQQLDRVAEASHNLIDPAMARHTQRIIFRCIASREYVHVLSLEEIVGTGFDSGTIYVLTGRGGVIGAVAMFPAQLGDSGDLKKTLGIVRALLENRLLNEELVISDALQNAARAVGENPSMQDLVTLLHDTLCGPHISLCVMFLYGPLREDLPNGPFEYMEVAGTWSRRLGAGGGTGMKIYLEPYADLLNDLEERRVVSFNDFGEISHLTDPLIRGFMRAERVRSLVLIALGSGGRRLGAVVLATSKTYAFPAAELRGYQTVSEFLALNTMTHVLQQQHDFVQRARAALLDAVTDGVLMVLPGGEHSRVLTVNQSFSNMFNIQPEQAQGLSLRELLRHMQIPEDVCHDLEAHWLSIPVREPSTQRGEFNMMHPEGYAANIEWYSAPVYQENRVMGRIYSFFDSTAQRISSALRANFISRVSHELRTPLTSIKGFAQFILESMGDDLPAQAREYTEIILNSARHLNNVFSDMIEITRADSGELPLHLETVRLPEIIRNVVALLELEYRARGQQITQDLDIALPAVMVDANRITQVLTNILGNAIKYAPPHSQIYISATYIDSPAQLPESAPPDVVIPGLLVTVADEGSGLTEQEAEQIFLPFHRGRNATTAKVEGTGLGLTIARSIIELHRGKIWAESCSGEKTGARFLFLLPTA